ncbi:MAG TPA: hypothetical protein VGD99_10100 [Anaerolineae bacterium]
MLFTKKYLLMLVIGLIAVMVLTTACAQAPEGPAGSGDEQAAEHDSDEEHAGDEEHAAEHDSDEEHAGDEEHTAEHDNDEEDAMEHGEHEHSEDGEPVIPNNGAVIRIVSPGDGIEIKADDIVEVEVEVENFTLGEAGNHWHIFVDGKSRGMVVGGDTDHVVRGLEPGEYEISAFMANGAHEQLEEGASIKVNVTE